jgi:hypothetical protein
MSIPQALRYDRTFLGVTTTVTARSNGSGGFTPKSFVAIPVAQVRSTLPMTTSPKGIPAFTVTSAGTNPS